MTVLLSWTCPQGSAKEGPESSGRSAAAMLAPIKVPLWGGSFTDHLRIRARRSPSMPEATIAMVLLDTEVFLGPIARDP